MQRGVAPTLHSGRSGQQVVQPAGQLGRGQYPQPRGGQFERQWQPVQPLRDPRQAVQLGPLQLAAAPGRRGALGQQPYRLARATVAVRPQRQRRDPPDHLAGPAQRLPAGGKDLRRPAGGQHAVGQRGGRDRLRLAGIEDQQETPVHRVLHDGVQHRPARFGTQPQGLGHGKRYQLRVGDRGQISEPGAVRVLVGDRGRDLHRQPGLTGAARPDDVDQPPPAHQVGEFGALGRPADEGGHRARQVVRRLGHRARPGKLPRQAGGDQLVQPLPVVEAAQLVQAQVEQPRPVNQVAGVARGGRRTQHLAAVRRRGDPRRAVHLRGGVLAAARVREAGVQAHPDQRAGLRYRPCVVGQCPLRLGARGQRVARVRERDEQRVALAEQGGTAAGGQRATQQPAVLGEHAAVPGTEHPRQPGGALDVGEQERHQAVR